ncbi:hypothetical protein GN156_02490 [bacterium LRH843]|nr:hypothetical protein [bacterium LRH843]
MSKRSLPLLYIYQVKEVEAEAENQEVYYGKREFQKYEIVRQLIEEVEKAENKKMENIQLAKAESAEMEAVQLAEETEEAEASEMEAVQLAEETEEAETSEMEAVQLAEETEEAETSEMEAVQLAEETEEAEASEMEAVQLAEEMEEVEAGEMEAVQLAPEEAEAAQIESVQMDEKAEEVENKKLEVVQNVDIETVQLLGDDAEKLIDSVLEKNSFQEELVKQSAVDEMKETKKVIADEELNQIDQMNGRIERESKKQIPFAEKTILEKIDYIQSMPIFINPKIEFKVDDKVYVGVLEDVKNDIAVLRTQNPPFHEQINVKQVTSVKIISLGNSGQSSSDLGSKISNFIISKNMSTGNKTEEVEEKIIESNVKKVKKQIPFREKTILEKLEYLDSMPIAIKPSIEITANNETYVGVLEDLRGDIAGIKTQTHPYYLRLEVSKITSLKIISLTGSYVDFRVESEENAVLENEESDRADIQEVESTAPEQVTFAEKTVMGKLEYIQSMPIMVTPTIELTVNNEVYAGVLENIKEEVVVLNTQTPPYEIVLKVSEITAVKIISL